MTSLNTANTAHDGNHRIRVFLTIYTTVQTFGLIMFFGIAPYFRMPIKSEEAVGIIELVLPLFSGYVGLMVGFYFGTKEAAR